MIQNKDGLAGVLQDKQQARLAVANFPRLNKILVSVFACPLFLLMLLPFDAQGFSGLENASTIPAVRVLANQAMAWSGEPAPSTEPDDEGAAANRPMRLTAAANPTAKDRPGESSGQMIDESAAAYDPKDETPDSLSGKVKPHRALGDSVVQLASDNASDPVVDQPLSQSGLRPTGSLIESMIIDQKGINRIRVAKNGSAVINLKRKADAVEIADPKIANVYLTSPTRIVVTGRGFGTTQMLVRTGKEQQALYVDVELDLSLLNSFIKSVSPASNVVARSVRGTIFITGTVPDADIGNQITEMAKLVQGGEVRTNLSVAGVKQTMLRVVVAEVNKTAMRQLGVNWAVGGSDVSRDFFFANNLGQLNPTVFGSSGVTDVLRGQQLFSMLPNANGSSTNVTFGFPRAEFQMFMNALRDNSLSRTLAEPNLVAISGQTATFLAGGEVPIPVAQGGAVAGAITIQYKEFGVRLSFTPTVLAGQIIRLHVMTEVSEAIPTNQSAGGLPLFTFTTRRAESTIECGNGQTFAIAGLLNDQIRAMASKIPALGDIPILGTLFSSTNYSRSLTEMVVLVTPQLVEPLDPHQVPPPPGSLMTEPSDVDLFTMQRLEGTPKPRPESDRVPRDVYPVKTRPGGIAHWPTSQLALRGPWGLAGFKEN